MEPTDLTKRFLIVETSLRDVMKQLAVEGRLLCLALDTHARIEQRLDDHDARLKALEATET
ncbi:MAG: hypothetical protein JNG84_10500 [Archangium sp.]|nr:hypothetical protein [Archangium sp.]